MIDEIFDYPGPDPDDFAARLPRLDRARHGRALVHRLQDTRLHSRSWRLATTALAYLGPQRSRGALSRLAVDPERSMLNRSAAARVLAIKDVSPDLESGEAAQHFLRAAFVAALLAEPEGAPLLVRALARSAPDAGTRASWLAELDGWRLAAGCTAEQAYGFLLEDEALGEPLGQAIAAAPAPAGTARLTLPDEHGAALGVAELRGPEGLLTLVTFAVRVEDGSLGGHLTEPLVHPSLVEPHLQRHMAGLSTVALPLGQLASLLDAGEHPLLGRLVPEPLVEVQPTAVPEDVGLLFVPQGARGWSVPWSALADPQAFLTHREGALTGLAGEAPRLEAMCRLSARWCDWGGHDEDAGAFAALAEELTRDPGSSALTAWMWEAAQPLSRHGIGDPGVREDVRRYAHLDAVPTGLDLARLDYGEAVRAALTSTLPPGAVTGDSTEALAEMGSTVLLTETLAALSGHSGDYRGAMLGQLDGLAEVLGLDLGDLSEQMAHALDLAREAMGEACGICRIQCLRRLDDPLPEAYHSERHPCLMPG